MLRVRFFKVKPDKVERLRAWMDELSRRRDEVLETFVQETVRHEAAWLLDVVEEHPLPIDLEHRAVMEEVLGAPYPAEQLGRAA